MKLNMGNIDRTIRISIAIVISVLFFTNIISGTIAIILLILAGIFVLTSFIGFCPVYTLLGINTCPSKKV